MTSDVPPTSWVRLPLPTLHGSLRDPTLSSMNFLNEVASRYPSAVSFAPGRPTEKFFEIDRLHRWIDRFCGYLRTDGGLDEREVERLICQYGRTKGIVHDLVARHLATDEGVDVEPEAIVVTVGAQEAMVLTLRTLRAEARDVVFAVEPTYVGLVGAARLLDMTVVRVAGGADGIDLDDLTAKIESVRRAGGRPRAVYITPDFANPSGLRMPVGTRSALLDVAVREDVLLLEDNAYGLFRGAAEALPTLKKLDRTGHVVYLGTFAKSVLPGARVGYVVADQVVVDEVGSESLLADELSKVKSMITVNTSPVAQAVVGGGLLESGGSLVRRNARERETYRANLEYVVSGLSRRFDKRSGLAWNRPAGGFFVVVDVPFDADDAALEESGRDFGVLWTPMNHFYEHRGGLHQVRLSVSSLEPDRIELGLDRLAAFVRSRTTSPT